ncbi:ribonuclease domain-containing protein [Streptomyces formicae]|uniref:Guanyl-specific ribonuclease Sa n=1 Tax=Streptomyces formicae TaxID=1616117 RepID=A0A291Q3S5_9ACTN|nr:ribonuclease domain-containing protein [Streptomyces formicae]ATL26262.1 Guanyl-specific ribonuclease Sa [Streptomyces formicae]
MLRWFVPRVLGVVLACFAVLVSGCSSDSEGGASASASAPAWARGMATVEAGQLPREARETLRRIDDGGPYPYAKDGTVFSNFERELPPRKRGYYHEYTVRTPGERDRGARRIVTGDGGETYYTDDHYASFKAVLRT